MSIEELRDIITKNISKIEQVEAISEYILSENNSTNPENAKSTEEVFVKYEALKSQHEFLPEIAVNTFTVYLSKVSKSPQSKINCDGRKQGYYIDLLVEQIEEIKEKEEREREEKITESERIAIESSDSGNSVQEIITLKEKDLYPFLKNWLLTSGFDRVADISSARKQGKWGNPDLVGFKIDNLFGTTEVEITTIEAKITNDDWEQWIFEAVAHTVFSNRSYYAFVHPKNLVNKIEQELRHYAEIFNLGILIISVSGENYLKIKNKETFVLTEENHSIIEYCPAKYNDTHLKYKKRFLAALEITEPMDLYNFGESLQK